MQHIKQLELEANALRCCDRNVHWAGEWKRMEAIEQEKKNVL